MTTPTPRLHRSELCRWLTDYLAQLLEVEHGSIDRQLSFEYFGLDSTAVVGLSGDLSDLLGTPFDAALAYEHPSIDALADHMLTLGLIAEDVTGSDQERSESA